MADETLQALIGQWREEGRKLLGEDLGVYLLCADELEAALLSRKFDQEQILAEIDEVLRTRRANWRGVCGASVGYDLLARASVVIRR